MSLSLLVQALLDLKGILVIIGSLQALARTVTLVGILMPRHPIEALLVRVRERVSPRKQRESPHVWMTHWL